MLSSPTSTIPCSMKSRLCAPLCWASTNASPNPSNGAAQRFRFNGNIATIPPRTKKAVQLFFQQSALIGARYGVLEGDGDQVRTINFKDKAEIAAKKAGLVKAIKAWIKHKGG